MNSRATKRGLGTRPVVVAVVLLGSLLARGALAQQQVGNYASRAVAGRSVVVTGASGEKIRITPYGDYIVRIQVAKNGETFYADDRYHMVERHDWPGSLTVGETASSLTLTTAASDGVSLSLAKQPMRFAFSVKNQTAALLNEGSGVTWSGNTVNESFSATTDEHFAGLGHLLHGHIDKLDRRGTSLKVTAGSEGALIA